MPDSKNAKTAAENETAEDTLKHETATGEVQTLKRQLEQKEEELAGTRDQFLRLQAETENFKKRIVREKNDFFQFANERLIKGLIPIYEDLKRALATPDVNSASLKEGVEMISRQLISILESENVKPIPAMGEKFDPAIHEALSQIETDKYAENTVIQEISKGYFLNDRVVNPAKVIISKAPVKDKSPKTIRPAEPHIEEDSGKSAAREASAETTPPPPPRTPNPDAT